MRYLDSTAILVLLSESIGTSLGGISESKSPSEVAYARAVMTTHL